VAEFEAVVSGDIYVLAPKHDRLLPELLPFLCLSERFFQHAVGTSAGSLSPRTNWSSLASFEFHLPPLDQQRRIAEILWAVYEGAQSQRNLEQSAITMRMTLLRETFKDLSAYPACRVDEAGDVQLGQQRHPKFQTGECSRPYLRVANVMDDYFDYSDVLSMDFAEGELRKFALEPGDILLNEGQSLELVGRCAMYDGAIPGCCFQKTLLRFRAFDGVSKEWSLGYFQFCQHFGIFASISSQTTSVAHLTALRFKALQFPRPALNMQDEFVERYRSIRQTLQDLRRHSDNLKAVQARILIEWIN
jgi:type I restriction enzyme S subunit